MKKFVTAILLLLHCSAFSQGKNVSSYSLINHELGVVDVVLNVPFNRANVRAVVKAVCIRFHDNKISVAIWKSKKYYLETNGGGRMLAFYMPTMGANQKWDYFLTCPDHLEWDESKNPFTY